MNCINEQLIQRYIDAELDAGENEQIEGHLSGCPACAGLVHEQKRLALSMKNAMNELTAEQVVVPPFVVLTKKKPAIRSKQRKLIFGLCLVAFVVLLWNHNQNEKLSVDDEITILGQTDWPVDANQPIGQQGLKVNLIDPEGNVTEYVLQ
jgi:anti-sigma factor RsiW